MKQKLAKISKLIYCGILISREPLVQSSDSQGLHRHLLRTAVIRDSSLSIGSSQPCTVPLPPQLPQECTYIAGGVLVGYLVSEPLVELFRGIQHQAFLLGAFLALGHQGRELIAFKQARNLQGGGNIIIAQKT